MDSFMRPFNIDQFKSNYKTKNRKAGDLIEKIEFLMLYCFSVNV